MYVFNKFLGVDRSLYVIENSFELLQIYLFRLSFGVYLKFINVCVEINGNFKSTLIIVVDSVNVRVTRENEKFLIISG